MSELKTKLSEMTFEEKMSYIRTKVGSLKNPLLAKFTDSILELFDVLEDDYNKLKSENEELRKKLSTIEEIAEDA